MSKPGAAAPTDPLNPKTLALSEDATDRRCLHWQHDGQTQQALWRSERGAAPPAEVVIADDRMSADAALRHANAGTALLWRGDFHNARHLLQAMARHADRRPSRVRRRPLQAEPLPADQAFHRHRQAQAQRARTLGAVLVPLDGDYAIPLRRAPDWRDACTMAWGPALAAQPASVMSLRELMGVASAFEWARRGVEVPALGPGQRIHPAYGVFSPLRGEYLDLVAQAPLPPGACSAFDIGTGTGVLAALLARRGLAGVVATEIDPRALACARDNLARLGLTAQVQLLSADLFPPGRADLVLCNPPWLPARPSAPIERAVYDEDSRMLLGFLAGLAAHLNPGGEGWLILSDLAEHLGLRSRDSLRQAIQDAGLVVRGRLDARPVHGKVHDRSDPLHAARAAELTSLWRLAAA